ncbi:DUF421 domain-containing protein [Bacillus sp. 31A1R]|uniref:DUF421 domain-containing protein n=1 Tax=Robertmurraya mangrovi TaxID=3098077 RepID=A0ABU5ITA1_9BACI|nr:DUF421 domain-containing protein [Bacillus sp. 31A1R]MDZ5470384.1 DUF421 domain-containing protein [Bacillus sp. 31A1R]
MEFVRIIVELVVGYFALFLLTKLLGKTQITQLTPFDFISALVLGELVGNALYDENIGISKIIFAVTAWGLLIYTTEVATQKSRKYRSVLEGTPSIIIYKGKIDYNLLKKCRLDLNQLQQLLRGKDIFSIRECEYAILEANGSLSVIKKSQYSAVTPTDLNLPTQPQTLPLALILDGEIEHDNLRIVNWDAKRLETEVRITGAHGIKDVLYAEWKEGEDLYVQKYESGS